MEDEAYEITDSEEEYTKDDKLLLEYARNSMKKKDVSSDEEVYSLGRHDSSDEDENDMQQDGDEDESGDNDSVDDIDMGSDLEDEEKLPDDRAWGKKKKSFYSTDFVDQDYDGVYQGEEAEIAEQEEQEAKNIQKRLLEQLSDADFLITEAIDIAEASEVTAKDEIIETDLSKLTKRQKLDLIKRESPEFFVLVEDFKQKMEEAQTFLSVINYFKSKLKQSFPALEFLQTRLTTILNYCTNISFYLCLKAKRIPVKNHPILKSLFRYRQLLQQMDDVNDSIIMPQLNQVLRMLKKGEEIPLDSAMIKKKTLKVLANKEKQRGSKSFEKQLLKKEKKITKEIEEKEIDSDNEMKEPGPEDKGKESEEINANEKRAITYEMAKNKGLTPKRKKELRNPRVKNRRKYEKAKIRRKGQVRQPRREIPLYGGEASGIKTTVTKSIKLK